MKRKHRTKRNLPKPPGPPNFVTVAERGPQGDREVVFGEEARQLVRDLAEYGVPQERICLHLINPVTGKPIDRGTLVRQFADELGRGMAKADMTLAKTAYQMAVGRPAEYDENGKQTRVELLPDKTMVIFLLKSRLRYKEDPEPEQPQDTFEMTIRARIGSMSYEERKALKHILSRAAEGRVPERAGVIDAEAVGQGER